MLFTILIDFNDVSLYTAQMLNEPSNTMCFCDGMYSVIVVLSCPFVSLYLSIKLLLGEQSNMFKLNALA